jgi:TRAP-type C4-dicarboxylate transport system permease small subunit
MSSGFGRALERGSRFLTTVGVLALAVMMVGTVADVILRNLGGRPLRGVVELVEITMLMAAFLGLPEAFLRREQIVVDLIDVLVPPSVLRVLTTVSQAVTMVVVWLIGYHVITPMLDAYRFGDIKFELGVPVYPLHAVVLLCFAASVATTAYVLVENWRGEREQGSS